MDYKKHHDLIIERAKHRILEGYTERHHIIPRCMGGTDDAENLVDLTPEEHYVVHQLLTQMHKGTEYYRKLLHAVTLMTVENKHGCVSRPKNKRYGWVKKRIAEELSNSMKGENNHFYGRTHTDETKKKISLAKLGKSIKRTQEHNQKIGLAQKGKPKSKQHRENISKNWTSRKAPMGGKKHSAEAKRKMKLAWVRRRENATN